MRENLARSLKLVFGHEGGWGNDPRDRGNWTTGVIGRGENKGTKYGIAAHVYPTLDIRNLTLAQAEAIYARDYAPPVAFNLQPAGVDYTVLDIGINAGPARAMKLQAASLGLAAGTTPRELALKTASLPNKVGIIKDINRRMLSFYQSLGTWKVYGRGWARRNAEREAVSVKWALEAGAVSPAETTKHLDQESGQAKQTSDKQAGGAVATGGGGATGGGASGSQVDVTQFDWTAWVFVGGVTVVIVGVTAFLVWHAWRNRARSKAYLDAAKGLIG